MKYYIILLICLCSLLCLYISSTIYYQRSNLFAPLNSDSDTDSLLAKNPNEVPSIGRILSSIKHGHWKRFQPSRGALDNVTSFIKAVRSEIFKLPKSLQRTDRKCGNVTITSTDNLKRSFRALCDPHGLYPCCENNFCVSKDKDACKCPGCFDLRSDDLHADFATYIPDDKATHMTTFKSSDDVCNVMSNVSLHFLGDSLVAHVFLTLMIIDLDGDINKVYRDNTPKSVRKLCQGQNVFIMNPCRSSTLNEWNFPKCKRKAYMTSTLIYRDVNEKTLVTKVKELRDRPYSVMFLGFGLHQNFDTDFVNRSVVSPIIKAKGHSRWPFFIFAGNHAWGMLRNPEYPTTNTTAVITFNKKLKNLMDQNNITFLDTFPMSQNVVSYDGTHYGLGLNQAKVQILLNIIQSLKNYS